MADDPKDPPDPKPDPKDDLGDAGKKALDEERRARREAERALKALQDKVTQLEDKDKSDSEKLTDRVAQAEKAQADAEAKVLRLEVATAKGLTAAQAKRLAGATREELEADADELLDTFKPDPSGSGTSTPSKPKEDLRGGGDPTEGTVETDPRKLAESVQRL